MSAESNQHLMHRFMELMNTGNRALAAELISPSALFHIPGHSAPLFGPAGYLTVLAQVRSELPDLRATLEDMVAEETRAAVRFTVRGTHRGAFTVVKSVGFYRLLGGQILEEYVQPDLATYLRSINPAVAQRRARPRAGSAQEICRNRSSLAFRYAAES